MVEKRRWFQHLLAQFNMFCYVILKQIPISQGTGRAVECPNGSHGTGPRPPRPPRPPRRPRRPRLRDPRGSGGRSQGIAAALRLRLGPLHGIAARGGGTSECQGRLEGHGVAGQTCCTACCRQPNFKVFFFFLIKHVAKTFLCRLQRGIWKLGDIPGYPGSSC